MARRAAALLAGMLGALGFPFVAAGVSPSPLLDALPREIALVAALGLLYRRIVAAPSRRDGMLDGLSFGIGFFAVLLYWLRIAMVEFARMAEWQAAFALALLVVYCAAWWALLLPLFALLRRRTLRRGVLASPVAFACAFLLVEWARGEVLTGFPWGQAGYAMARVSVVIQLAAVGGVHLVTWCVALFSALLADCVAARHGPGALRAGLRTAGLLAVICGVGGLVSAFRPEDPRGEGIAIAVVQGNVDQRQKLRDVAYRDEILARYWRGSRDAVARGAALVVWPEAAWPGQRHARSHRLAARDDPPLGVPMLIGASTFERLPSPDGEELRSYNSAFWVDGQGRVRGRYDKRHLVPFGEYVPMGRWLPIDKLVTGMTDYSAGTDAAPLGEPAIGVLICYDGVFPALARSAVRAGARVMANLTNDAWYGVSSAPYQHLDFYALRAVESGRWLVRAANTGVSAIVAPNGDIVRRTGLDTEAVLVGEVHVRDETTLYAWLGDWPVAVVLGLLCVALGRGLSSAGRLTRWARPGSETSADADRSGDTQEKPG